MTNDELNIALYEKLYDEQERFRAWLLDQPPETIIQHSFEYAIREDIVSSMEEGFLPDAEAQALLNSASPLKDVFETFRDTAPSYMDEIRDSLSSTAYGVIRAKALLDKSPLYRESATYAHEHDELDAYRTSRKANIACKEAIEDAIRDNYSDNHLDLSCVTPIIDRFGAERVEYVLANTVQYKDWDERFSRSNREWAKTIPVVTDGNDFVGDRRTAFVVDRSHSGLTDMFVTAFRKEQQKMRETPARMSIYDQLRRPLQPTAPLKQRHRSGELR